LYEPAGDGDAVIVAEEPSHTVAEFTVTVGFGVTVSVPEFEPEQLFPLVMVTP